MFDFLKKKKKMHYVLKLFTIVDYPEAVAYKVLDVLDFCIANINDEIGDISWNYGNKHWKKYESFRKFEQQQRDSNASNLYAVDLDIYSAEKRLLSFSNTLLNSTKKWRKTQSNPKGTVEITIYIDENSFAPQLYNDFFRMLAEKENFDYGYICHIPEKEDTHNVIVNTAQIDIAHSTPFAIEHGYVRDIYLYNLLNPHQLENIQSTLKRADIGNVIEISSNLTLWALTNEEIELVKTSISFPLLPTAK